MCLCLIWKVIQSNTFPCIALLWAGSYYISHHFPSFYRKNQGYVLIQNKPCHPYLSWYCMYPVCVIPSIVKWQPLKIWWNKLYFNNHECVVQMCINISAYNNIEFYNSKLPLLSKGNSSVNKCTHTQPFRFSERLHYLCHLMLSLNVGPTIYKEVEWTNKNKILCYFHLFHKQIQHMICQCEIVIRRVGLAKLWWTGQIFWKL